MHFSGKMSKEIAEEYASSLADLKVNSKPLINMLTILAEENIEHAGVIVDTVEKHLEKVQPEIKLPVLYLVDSIIKNVGGAYTQKFSQSIVNMFTRTFKQVDEKTRSQMFKLRETWHEVFPSTKLYQLDVKVNLIDPAWPIQAQPHPNPAQAQANIHVNPNFLKKQPTPPVKSAEEEEQMRLILAKKEQELLMLQRKKVEMELEQTRKQLQMAEKSVSKGSPVYQATVSGGSAPMANQGSVIPPLASLPVVPPQEMPNMLPAKARLGPPVPKTVNSARIAPVSSAMLAATRRDPRLARHNPSASNMSNIAPNLFDIKPLRNKRKAITIDVQPDFVEPTRRTETRRDPRLDKRNENKRIRDAKRNRDQDRYNRDEDRINRDEDKRNNRDEDVHNAEDEKPTNNVDIRKNTDKRKRERITRKEEDKRKKDDKQIKEKVIEQDKKEVESPTKVDDYIKQVVDAKVINKLPPIPRLNRDDKKTETNNKKKEIVKDKKKKKDADSNSNSSDSPSPDKRLRKSKRNKDAEPPAELEKVQFKELKNFHKERYMRRNKEKSESPEKITTKATEAQASSAPDPILENKDVDLRVLALPDKPAPITQKRSSTEIPDVLSKKSKVDKFDILFGHEDVDLRQLPQVEETTPKAPDSPKLDSSTETAKSESPARKALLESISPILSPKQDWNQVKEKSDEKKKPSKLDLVRAKLAKATEGKDKDRLGRPLLFSKSPSLERERKRTISSEDQDLRGETEDDVNKETISLILSQAKEHFKDGKMDKNQYNTLMFQVMQLNEKLKLKEAKQRESLENSKRKLHIAQKANEAKLVASPKSSPRQEQNNFGDIDERITPVVIDKASNSQDVVMKDCDLRMGPLGPMFDKIDPVPGPMGPNFIPMPPMMPFLPMPGPLPGPGQFPMPMPGLGPFPPMWGAPMSKDDLNGPRRAPAPFFRGAFERLQRPTFEPRFVPPMPKFGMCQGECPLPPYERSESPPALGTPGLGIPPTDYKVLEFIDQDPMKTIEIDSVPREIRFYGETAIVMLDWDDPREIRFLTGSRRITFDNKDSVVLNFNDEYRQVEIDDQVFDIRLGAPTRELFINGKWYECFFGAAPIAVMIENKPRMIQLEGPPPQVDIGKEKRTDLVAGKINLIVDAQHMCPLFLDAKVQKLFVDGHCYTIRFADAFKTVLINERPYKVEFGGLPKPIFVGKNKHFIRFSVLPRHVKPGQTVVANMPGKQDTVKVEVKDETLDDIKMEVDQNDDERPERIISPDSGSNHGGLDMLASVMPSTMAPASAFSGYSAGESKDGIPGLDVKEETSTNQDSQPNPLSILGNINVNDLFAKLVATGIVSAAATTAEKENQEPKETKNNSNTVHHVDLLKPETLRVKQPAVVALLYGGMQCSGCGARFPPEHTVRYSQHLDWHFRQNRRDRDSARRAVSRLWHYDLGDWLQYEEYTDQHDAEKNYFDSTAENPSSPPASDSEEPPSVRAGPPVEHTCALCGDKFDQFYNEDKDEWHLRKAVRHDDRNYHPLCFDDYKVILEKEKEQLPTPVDEIEEPKLDKADDCIEIVEEISQSESDVEVLDNEKDEPVEIEDTYIESGDEDDVVLEQEPVDEVEVDDDDTDDETKEVRATRDLHVDLQKVVVKQEPLDPDDEPIITAEEEAIRASADTTRHIVLSSIDGNVELNTAPQIATSLAGGIRINITKPINSTPAQDTSSISSPLSKDDVCASDEPLPPGEEPEITYKVKDSLKGVEFSIQPPVRKGNELSGLCSIM